MEMLKEELIRNHQRMVAYEKEEEDIDLMDGEKEWGSIAEKAAGAEPAAGGMYADEEVTEDAEQAGEPSLEDPGRRRTGSRRKARIRQKLQKTEYQSRCRPAFLLPVFKSLMLGLPLGNCGSSSICRLALFSDKAQVTKHRKSM